MTKREKPDGLCEGHEKAIGQEAFDELEEQLSDEPRHIPPEEFDELLDGSFRRLFEEKPHI